MFYSYTIQNSMRHPISTFKLLLSFTYTSYFPWPFFGSDFLCHFYLSVFYYFSFFDKGSSPRPLQVTGFSCRILSRNQIYALTGFSCRILRRNQINALTGFSCRILRRNPIYMQKVQLLKIDINVYNV